MMKLPSKNESAQVTKSPINAKKMPWEKGYEIDVLSNLGGSAGAQNFWSLKTNQLVQPNAQDMIDQYCQENKIDPKDYDKHIESRVDEHLAAQKEKERMKKMINPNKGPARAK